MSRRSLAAALLALGLSASVSAAAEAAPIAWEAWSDDLFARATREHKFVLLDLEAIWCHWCHVMDERTYSDPAVAALVAESFIPVRVDQDARPDLAERYQDYGWPATIVFAPDGSERVKLAGYYGAKLFAGVLQGALGTPAKIEVPAAPAQAASRIPEARRASFEHDLDASYDKTNGGWGRGYKFVDAMTMAYAMDRARAGDAEAERRARFTLDQSLKLVDPVWGGVYQYSDEADWKSPHFEKIMPVQATYLSAYSLAFARWNDPRYRDAAGAIYRYLRDFLRAPNGGFYVSQDADLSASVDGHRYYALDEGERRKLGEPSIDKHEYAREAGLAAIALARYAEAIGDHAALAMAREAADWAIKNRTLPDGGFRHDTVDRYGPYLADSLAMAEAFLELYRASGERRWLTEARRSADFILAKFSDATTGALLSQTPREGERAYRPVEANIAAARLLNLLSFVSGEPRYRAASERLFGYLISPQVPGRIDLLPGALLLDRELAREPVHVTVVGAKSDALARQLFAAASAYPVDYKRVDWWDRAEGPLPNSDVEFPDEPAVAAYACSQNICSLPVTESGRLTQALDRLAAKSKN